MYKIGAVVDEKRCEVALYDAEYTLLQKKLGGASELSSLSLELLTEKNVKADDVAYVGIAVDAVLGDPSLYAAEAERTIGIKCLGASLMGARALGEAYLTNDVSSLFLLKVADTVECGVVIDKKLYEGVHLRGGNVAHMVINFGGYECTCGKRGCLEAYASNAGLRKIAAEAGVEGAESITHATLFNMNTPNAERAKELYVKYFACGVTNLVNLFQLEEFVLDGAIGEAGDKIMAPLMDIVLTEQFSHNMPDKCNVRFASKEADTATLGAALLGR
ncbi:MAG: ROK family protein [Ruminococcaceae bacterium]|nr:ROK family protein [Oscillospiraceae bacterium]